MPLRRNTKLKKKKENNLKFKKCVIVLNSKAPKH